ncbi:MAG: sulfatase [Myxococcota bacterium]|jgi:arylsulfatase A-like enzyme|nr:sulfatase [Myxococcota bacterium]
MRQSTIILSLFAFFLPVLYPQISSQAHPQHLSKKAAQADTVHRTAKTPHIVVLTVDTLRADMLGFSGGPAKTPNIDALAAQSWVFANCISSSMLTSPSHASIFTSLYPRDHGVYDNASGIHDNITTIAEHVKRFDYATGALINFPHLNPEISNLGQGFDKIIPARPEERRAELTTSLALNIFDRLPSEKSKFLWLHYVDPHAPYDAPHHNHDGHDAQTPITKAIDNAPGFQKHNQWFKKAFSKYKTTEELVERYIAEIEYFDLGLGQLISGLKKRGVYDDTILVLTSDHGENLGEHNLYFHHGGLYRSTTHVPLIMKAPGQSGSKDFSLTQNIDIAPTILDLAAIPYWQGMRGRSLAAQIQGNQPPRDFAFSEHMHGQLVSIRTLNHSLILHRENSSQFPNYPFQAGHMEFYDLTHDPKEQHTLKADSPIAQNLRSVLENYLEHGPKWKSQNQFALAEDSLRALGYIE